MEKKISPYQLFAAMFLLPYGSAALFYLAADAKQDAWIALLLYIIPGMLLQLIYLTLFKYYPEDSLVTCLPKIFGKLAGSILSFLYILYFAYIAARVLRDFTGLVITSTSPAASLYFIAAILMAAVSYAVLTGIKTICRATEIIFPIFIMGLVASYILLFTTKNILVFNRLLPIMENGPIEIVKSWRLMFFPFSETIAFTMVYNLVREPEKIRKITLGAIITEGVVLSTIAIMYITSLGVAYASSTYFPLLESLRLIKVGGFLDRLDILIIVTLVIGGFIKITFFTYFSILGTAQLFKIKNQNYLIVPFALVILIFSNKIAKSYPLHINIGFEFTPKYIQLPLHVIIPIIAVIIAWLKNRNKKP